MELLKRWEFQEKILIYLVRLQRKLLKLNQAIQVWRSSHQIKFLRKDELINLKKMSPTNKLARY